MDWRCLLLPLLLSGGEVGPRGVGAQTCSVPPSGPTSTMVGNVSLWVCSSNSLWSTGDVVYQTECGPGQLETSATCGEASPSTASRVTCSPVPPPAPPNTTTTTVVPNSAFYYQCVAPMVWLSGEPGRLSQCLLGKWSTVYDVCDEDCPMPRDCSTVADMGFSTSDVYNIVPSGNSSGGVAQVYCNLSSDSSDTGWTLVLYNSNYFPNSYTTTPTNTFPYLGTQPYFLGINNLSALNWNGTTPRPLVVRFSITLTNDKTYFAIYSGVQIAHNPPWTLTQVGDYHGTAGDSFSGNLNQVFQTSSDWWWAMPSGVNSSKLSSVNMVWGTLTAAQTIRRAMVFVRPQDYDSDHACPPEVGMEPWWRNISITFPIIRNAGTVISYQCEGELFMAGNSTTMAERVTMDSTTCVALTNGTLVWNNTMILPPCQLTCPDNYVKTVDGNSCARFSDDDATYGIVTASLRCRDEEASLALLKVYGNHSNIVNNQYYYTAHVSGKSGFFQPQIPSILNIPCAPNENCQVPQKLECYTVTRSPTNTLQGRSQSCFLNTTRYICMRPAFCPTGYSQYKGLCYKVVSSVFNANDQTQARNLVEALMYCMDDGGSLAYPESLDVLKYLETLVRMTEKGSKDYLTNMSGNKTAIIGLNKRNNWTGAGVYAPDHDLILLATAATVNGYLQRYLTVDADPAKGYQLTEASRTFSSANVDYVICQLYGLNGCLDDLPPPTDNMTLIWNNDTHVGSTSIYRCYPGYFVLGNISIVNQTWKCHGFLGDWVNVRQEEQLLNCFAVDVCNEASIGPVPHFITNVTSQTHLQLNGTINFTCPLNMSTQQGATQQNLTCSINNNEYSFRPAFIPCNVCTGRPVVENATLVWNNIEYLVGTSVVSTCMPGYYLAVTTSTQTLTCSDTGWTSATSCYEGCGTPPSAGQNMAMDAFSSNTLGSMLYYNCSQGMLVPETFPDVKDHLVLTCVARVWSPSVLSLSCAKLCLGAPPALGPPGTSTWDNTTRTAGTQLQLSCPTGYLFADFNSTINVTCEDDGNWTFIDTSIFRCRIKATTSPPQPPGTDYNGPAAPYWQWDVLNYTCPGDLMSASGANFTSVTFNGTNWVPEDPGFMCLNVCRSDPPAIRLPGNSTWNGKTRSVDTQIVLACQDPYVFPDLTSSVNITCEPNSHNWTFVDTSTLVCRIVARESPPQPPGSEYSGPDPPYWQWDVLNYTCPENTMSPEGTNATSITFNGTHWVLEDPNFKCLNVCGPPPPSPQRANLTLDGKPVTGTEGVYSCLGGFLGTNSTTFNITCSDQGWTFDQVPICKMCYTPPPPPGPGMTRAYTGLDEWGALANYTCDTAFIDGNTTISVTCHQGNWTITVLPDCLPEQCDVTYTGPTTKMETLSIACISWNVETTWPEEDLHELMGIRKDPIIKRGLDSCLPDLYIVCLQEVKSQPQNVVMDTLFEEPWTNALREVIGPHNYVRVTGERLQGLVTNIFVKRHHLHNIRDIHTSVVRTGFGGFWGNKGAASIRFSLYGCSICIVNCHLAAHDSGYKERVEHFNTIVDSTGFPIKETSNILYHDYVFWIGDMNFRFESHMTSEAIAKHISEANWSALEDVDELRKAQKSGDAFSMLKEGALNFPPTYKYLEGTDKYDFSRRPAWTDRILHQVHVDAYENVKLGVEQTSYSPIESYTQSDHKPVMTTYKIKVFANHEDRCVHFEAPGTWVVGEGGPVKFTLDSDVVTSPWDYIALYKVDFTSMHQYITYTYIPQPTLGNSSQCTFQLLFNDELLQHPGMYRLVYYSGKYSSYLGMSEPFPVIASQS